ncbi:MAG: tetratricopeptide repeat protein [Bacteroidetes bacterium]|nr:tetratricopeptide repeat protein [Bacteroidota bacterium]
MNLKQVVLGLALVATSSLSAVAQCKQQIWPADKAKAEECVAVFGDAVKQGHYRAATASLQWMMTNAPNWNTKLYVDAATAYDGLAGQEKDAVKKKVLVDSLMLIYDLRLKNCGDEVNVLNRKAAANVKYNINNKEKAAELLAMYDRVYEISGNNVNDNNLEAYISVIYVNYLIQKNLPEAQKTLTEEQILARYDKLVAVIEAKTQKAQAENKIADADKYKSIKANVDDKLSKMVTINCAFVKKNWEPRFRQNPTDVVLAKKIFQAMLNDKCTDDPLWFEATEVVHKASPDFTLAQVLGAKYLQAKNFDKALPLLNEALTLATTPADKGKINILLGDNENQKGNKQSAREFYRKAIAADPTNKDGFEKIGDLYYFSFAECSRKQSLAEDRLVYIAAYDMYAKAGSQDKMKSARGQFPSVTELFELNWKEGDVKKIDKCWVGETVTLRTRGKE